MLKKKKEKLRKKKIFDSKSKNKEKNDKISKKIMPQNGLKSRFFGFFKKKIKKIEKSCWLLIAHTL